MRYHGARARVIAVAPGRHFVQRRIRDAVRAAAQPCSVDEIVIASTQPRTCVERTLEDMVRGGSLVVEYDGRGQRCYAPRREGT